MAKTVTQTEPSKIIKPHLIDALKESSRLYHGPQPQYYPDSTVAPQSQYTTDGLTGLGNYVSSPFYQNSINQGQDVMSGFMGAADPQNNPGLQYGMQMAPGASQYIQSLYGQGGAGTQGGYSDALASQWGGMAPGQNQYTQGLIDSVLQRSNRNFQEGVLPTIASGALADNAYGGSRQGVAQGIATRGLAEDQNSQIAQILSQQYNNDLSRQQSMAGQADQTNLARAGLGANAAQFGMSQLTQGYGQGQAGLSAAANFLPTASQMPAWGYQTQVQAGGADQAYQQQLVNDQVNRFNYYQQQPTQSLNTYLGQLGQLPMGGSSSTPGPSVAQGAMAGALAGASTGNPYIMLGGAALGALGTRL